MSGWFRLVIPTHLDQAQAGARMLTLTVSGALATIVGACGDRLGHAQRPGA